MSEHSPAEDDPADEHADSSDDRLGLTVHRVAVRRDPTLASGLRPVAEMAERTPVGDAYIRSLIRTQLMLSIRLSIVLVGLLAALPALFIVAPSIRRSRVFGAPIAWPLLGFGIYPLLVGIAVAFVRRAGRTEAEFVELVDPAPGRSTSGPRQ